MVLILIDWIYMAIVCYSYGFMTLWLLEKLGIERTEFPFSLVCLLGLAQVSALSTTLSLFINIGALAVILISSIPIIFFGWHRHFRDEVKRIVQQFKATPRLYILIAIAIQVILALKCSANIFFHYDTGFYHAPSLRWIETYGVVPGLVNVLAPLGVDSMWLQPNALFGFAFLLSNPLHKAIGLTICWSIYLVLGKVKDSIQNRTQPSFSSVFHTLTLIPLVELCSNLTSPSTDEPSAIFILLVLVLTAQFIEMHVKELSVEELSIEELAEKGRNSGAIAIYSQLITIFSVYAVAIKLSTIPILFCPIYVMWTNYRKRHFRLLGLQMGIFGEFLIPKALRTLILSGYLLYPFPYLDLFNPDWKMPKSFVISELEWIQSWARLPNVDKKLVLSGGMPWFPNWLNTFLSTPIIFALATTTSIFIMGLVRARRSLQIVIEYGVLYVTAVVGVLYWFSAAPFIRFGFGFLWGLILLMAVPPILLTLNVNRSVFEHPQISRICKGLAIASLVTLLPVMLYSVSNRWQPLGAGIMPSKDFAISANYRLPGAYPRANTIMRRACGFDLYQPITGQLCWYSELPCSPFFYGEATLRSSNLRDGFRSVQSCPTATTIKR